VTLLNSILLDIKIVPALLILIGAIGIIAIYLAYRKKEIQIKGSPLRPDLKPKATASLTSPSAATPSENIAAPIFKTFQKQPWAISDWFHAFLVLLSLIVATGFVLIFLSQSTFDRMAKDLQSLGGVPRQEQIALLFFGDEAKDNELQIKGVVRNISNAPIEQLDAVVRLYSHTGGILETVLVRMDKEAIAPDEIGQFLLVYPNYKKEIARYAVEFKLRQGSPVAYKDMRMARQQTNGNP
jgi:hypothetical protein